MLNWPSGAPFIFDIVGGGVWITLVFAFFGIAGWRGPVANPSDPRSANYERRAAALAGCALSLYILFIVASSLGTWVDVLTFILRAIHYPQPWSVWCTVIGWGLITAVSVFNLARSFAVPMGPRMAIPYGRYLIQGTIFGGLWLWGGFFPSTWAWRGDWWWYFILSVNFSLKCLYLACTAESLFGLTIALFIRSGNALRSVQTHMEVRNAPMRPAHQSQEQQPGRRKWL